MEIPEKSKAYLDYLARVQEICTPLDFRLVGGALTNFITPQTSIKNLDCKVRTLTLKDHVWPTTKRKDGSTVDIDMICFAKDRSQIISVKKSLVRGERGDIPHVSLEPAIYASWGMKKNTILEFVSSITMDTKNKIFLSFGPLQQEISWESIKPWTIILENNLTLTTLNPYAHLLRYAMRMPSGIKSKDKDRLKKSLEPFVEDFLEKAKKQGYDYMKEYADWKNFADALTSSQKISIQAKRLLTHLYWETIGTKLAHGKGILHTISTFGDKFTG